MRVLVVLDRVRFVGTVRSSTVQTFGAAQTQRAMWSGRRVPSPRCSVARRGGAPFDAAAVRDGACCWSWLAGELARAGWDRRVAVAAFARLHADPRYGAPPPAQASFSNADDDLLPLADLWLQGRRAAAAAAPTRVPHRRGSAAWCDRRGSSTGRA